MLVKERIGMRKGFTFGSRFDVVSKKGSLATVAVGPTQTNRREGLAEHEVPWTAWGPRLGTSRHVSHLSDQKCDILKRYVDMGEAYRWRTIVDRLCADAELVRDSLLKVVNKPV